jgi:hypothetical protein
MSAFCGSFTRLEAIPPKEDTPPFLQYYTSSIYPTQILADFSELPQLFLLGVNLNIKWYARIALLQGYNFVSVNRR